MLASNVLRTASRPLLELFTRQYCGLCEAAHETVLNVQKKVDLLLHPFDLQLTDVDQPQNKQWLKKYMFDVPVLHVNGELFGMHRLDEDELSARLKELGITNGQDSASKASESR
ncbi:thioredoxin-like protein [Gaertneriomyces semiglobifer]|nr:thioredoxin-like protein [Gaertneriomyces semiglobifer]